MVTTQNRTIKVGTYTAKRREDLLNSFSKGARGPYCIICGKPMKSEKQSGGDVWTAHAESEVGETIFVSDSYDYCIIENGGGGTDVAIGPECAKLVQWTERTLTADEIKEIEEHG